MLCLSNIAANALVVAPGCQIAMHQWSTDPLGADMCKTAHLIIYTAAWALQKGM